MGFLNHEQALGYYPSGGWGYLCSGVPDRGAGIDQPGDWSYNVLPYIEQQQLHDLGADGNRSDPISAAKRDACVVRAQTSIALFNCPSRRSGTIFLVVEKPTLPAGATWTTAARTDYAVNGGSAVRRQHLERLAGLLHGCERGKSGRRRQLRMAGAEGQRHLCHAHDHSQRRSPRRHHEHLYDRREVPSHRPLFRRDQRRRHGATNFCGFDDDRARWTTYNSYDLDGTRSDVIEALPTDEKTLPPLQDNRVGSESGPFNNFGRRAQFGL